jgi:hypothetical protein
MKMKTKVNKLDSEKSERATGAGSAGPRGSFALFGVKLVYFS